MTPKITDAVATLALANFERPIGVSILPAGQTWSIRQKVQYEAMKGLMKEEFQGLADFKEQLELYSKTNITILTPAYSAIRPLVGLNRKLLQDLVMNPDLGMTVGRFLTKLVGFSKSFSVPTEILEDASALKSQVSSQ